jgi:hypothetical protein
MRPRRQLEEVTFPKRAFLYDAKQNTTKTRPSAVRA